MKQLIKNPNFIFTDKIKYTIILSTILLITGVISIFFKGFNMGVDFTGGLSVEIKSQPINLEELRKKLLEVGLNPELQSITKENYILKFKLIEENFEEKLKTHGFEVLKVEFVGPKIGSYIIKRAYYAVIFSLIGILIYIAFRFKNMLWGVASIIALLHDVILSLAFLSITNIEFNLVTLAAILTIAGYSINDTIIVFDRIRENLKLNPLGKLKNIIDLSINQVLSRTIITGISVLLITLAIALIAKESINDFSYVMIFGILIGTYSSIYVAAPIVLLYENKKI
ncbi:MAG: protein translocase subunit SecF [bacterium]|nr:protein translocase subunit SecF [bacterium]